MVAVLAFDDGLSIAIEHTEDRVVATPLNCPLFGTLETLMGAGPFFDAGDLPGDLDSLADLRSKEPDLIPDPPR